MTEIYKIDDRENCPVPLTFTFVRQEYKKNPDIYNIQSYLVVEDIASRELSEIES